MVTFRTKESMEESMDESKNGWRKQEHWLEIGMKAQGE